MKDLIFLDIALDSTFRTAIERSYEELNDATPEVESQILIQLRLFYLIFFFSHLTS
jgi:hypothetical protein